MVACRSLEVDNAVSTIASLQQHLETIRQAEIDRFRRRLNGLSSEQEKVVGLLTRSLVDDILRTPITILKAASAEKESATFMEMTHRIFNLRDNCDHKGRGK